MVALTTKSREPQSWAMLQRLYRERHQISIACYASMTGIADSTVRTHERDNSSPKINDVFENASNYPTEFLLSVLQELGGSRFVIEPADVVRDCDVKIVADVMGLTGECNEFAMAFVEAASDGHFDHSEKSTIRGYLFRITGRVRRISVQFVAVAGRSLSLRMLIGGRS